MTGLFDIFVIVAFAALLGTLLGAAAILLVAGNAVRSWMIDRSGPKLAELELERAAAVERELRAFDLAASGGRREDASALSAERLAHPRPPLKEASNDPGARYRAPFGLSPRRRCSVCEKLRFRVRSLFAKKAGGGVAADTHPEAGRPGV